MNARNTILLISTVCMISAASLAYDEAETLIVPQEQNNISFVTGGFGEEERQLMNIMRKDYNLHVMNSNQGGSFSGEVDLIIYHINGEELVRAQAGPLFHALLPTGSYVVAATSEGKAQKKPVKIRNHRPTNLHFVWK